MPFLSACGHQGQSLSRPLGLICAQPVPGNIPSAKCSALKFQLIFNSRFPLPSAHLAGTLSHVLRGLEIWKHQDLQKRDLLMNNASQFLGFETSRLRQRNRGLVRAPQGGCSWGFSLHVPCETYPFGRDRDMLLKGAHADGAACIQLHQMRLEGEGRARGLHRPRHTHTTRKQRRFRETCFDFSAMVKECIPSKYMKGEKAFFIFWYL